MKAEEPDDDAFVARVRDEVVKADRRARILRNRQLGRPWNLGVSTGPPEWLRRRRAAKWASA